MVATYRFWPKEIAMPKRPGIKEKTIDSAQEESWKKTGEIEDLARKMSPIFLPRKSAFRGAVDVVVMLGGAVDWQPVEHLVGQVTHQFVDDLANRLDPSSVAGCRVALLALSLLEEGQGFLQDGGFGRALLGTGLES
jgi:hypothetical protein